MVYCSHCAKNVAGERMDDGFLCCVICGKVLEDYFFTEEPTFVKNTAGQSKLSGNYVRTVQSEFSESRQRTLDRAHEEIKFLSSGLGVQDEHMADQALAFYKLALGENFTRGRKSELVQAACLYIAFRDNNKPYLLIDFSNYLRIDVYALGSVFLQLCEVLKLGEHPIVQRPIDPSLFIHRYTKNLIKRGSKAVSDTALSLVASMKRDWMQTGRKPSGLCGAALYISAFAHGIKCSKPDIDRSSRQVIGTGFLQQFLNNCQVTQLKCQLPCLLRLRQLSLPIQLPFEKLRIVHVCEQTLTKRLVEFENTKCSSLTVEELDTLAKEQEKNPTAMPEGELKGVSKDLLCEHKDSGASHFALGLCEECYKDLDMLSGGLGGGSDPPAFQRAEREREKRALLKESVDEACDLANASNDQFKSHREDLPVPEGANVAHESVKDGECDDSFREDESETLSDIDDEEVDLYIHDEKGRQIKKILWEEANREYLEEQAAKEAIAEANKKVFEANFENCSEDLLAARELAASASEAVAKSRKEMKQRRANEAKSMGPAQSAAEAFGQMSNKKRQLQSLKSKVNFDRLGELFNELEKTDDPKKEKKARFDPPLDNHDNLQSFEHKNDDEMGSVDEFEDDTGEMIKSGLSTDNIADTYFPEDDEYGYNDHDY
ncbi:transcription factor IIIB 90 kDa subunit isoform X2 [Vigna radiata var. radiata]|uniref:Transcription factor IIIB 90 kDa subunit isoform X2 n=1 Tax=Vigna radiata var. radiata TaxID=3916 RepID=A0A3Q0ENX1_VIGRR|nr:transcription factor IIIB 90 kDa subunit isoform X2 [Vigna radiata var. radiata]